jgi:hypothetical protein
MYRLTIDAERAFIDVTMKGFLEVHQVHDYVDELTAKFTRAFPPGAPYVMLIDISECALQSTAVVDAFRNHVANFPRASRLAIVSGNSSARMQLNRILVRDYLRFFAFRAEAVSWLMELQLGDDPPKAVNG